MCYLVHTLCKLLTLHGIDLLDHSEMLGREGGDTLELYFHSLLTNGIADGEDAGIEYTDDITCISLVDDLTLGSHHLLRLGEAERLCALYVIIILAALKLTRADTHKRNSVAVSLVHVRLDFEYERGEAFIKRIYNVALCDSGQGGGSHFKEMLKERLDTEVVKR